MLRAHVVRSCEIIDEPRIKKINLTTGPMAIMGSTRMQATSIQLCVMITILEMVVCDLSGKGRTALVPGRFLASLEQIHAELLSPQIRERLAGLVASEESAYRSGRKSSYFADALGIDVLTDTTERSPTFCIPAFRKWDDCDASESWAYLFLPYGDSDQAWTQLLKRPSYCLKWTDAQIRSLVPADMADRQCAVMKQVGASEIRRFRIGIDGLRNRPWDEGDAAVCVVSESELGAVTSPEGFYRVQMELARASGASTAMIYLGGDESIRHIKSFLTEWDVPCKSVLVPMPDEPFLLDGITHIGVKMLLNALSTCIMARLGRVIGNCMAAVAPSNLKLIDRSIRYIQTLTGLPYEDACRELFGTIEYVRPRMQSGRAYPPVVKLTVAKLRSGSTLEQAEEATS